MMTKFIFWHIYGIVFWLICTNAPIMNNVFSFSLKCQKILEKDSRCTSWYAMFTHKILWEKDNFYGLCKKDKTTSRKRLFCMTENCLFSASHKTCHFSRNVVCGHIMSGCTPRFFQIFFYILKYVFKQWVHLHLWSKSYILTFILYFGVTFTYIFTTN
jgi:hypothetical protein